MGKDGVAIYLNHTDRTKISGTSTVNTTSGISTWAAHTVRVYGSTLMYHSDKAFWSDSNTTGVSITHSNILDSGIGISLSQDDNALLLANTFRGNDTGLLMRSTRNTRVIRNTFQNNDQGVELSAATQDNEFFKNDFIDNGGSDCLECHAIDEGENHWNRTTTPDCPVGNYWSGFCHRMGVCDMCSNGYETCVAGFGQWTFYAHYAVAPNGRDLHPAFNPWNME